MRIRLTDIRDHLVQELDLPLDARDMPGWQSGVVGWSIGRKGTGAPIELDEPLVECHVGVFTASYQVLLWGRAKKLPEVWLFPQGKSHGMLVPFEPERWLRTDREELARVAMGGDVRLRMDQSPIRLGNYIIETIKSTEVVKEVCAFCNEPLRTYFRVGSPQACPPCTEKFKQEFRANVAKGYWKALGAGIVASVVCALIHGVLLLAAHVSLGSILIGVLVPTAMKVASKGTGGLKHRMTAVILTYIAGTLPTSFLLPDNASAVDEGRDGIAVADGSRRYECWGLDVCGLPGNRHVCSVDHRCRKCGTANRRAISVEVDRSVQSEEGLAADMEADKSDIHLPVTL